MTTWLFNNDIDATLAAPEPYQK